MQWVCYFDPAVPKIVANINRQGWDERAYQRPGHGFCPTGEKGDGNFESLARSRMSSHLYLLQLADNMTVDRIRRDRGNLCEQRPLEERSQEASQFLNIFILVLC